MIFKTPRKILAIKLRALGDTLLMTAPLAELRAAFPEAEIHVIVIQAWVPLLEGHPGIDRITGFERNRNPASRAKAVARLALKLRREKYDCVVNFHASPSSSTLGFATGAPVRAIHFHGHKDRNRYSTVVVPGKGMLKPIIERDMDVLRALGLHVPAGRLPRLPLQDHEVGKARERMSALSMKGPVLGLGLAASRPTKSWPTERFAALAIRWIQKTEGSALAFLAASEIEIAQAFLREVDEQLSSVAPEMRSAIRARLGVEVGLPLRLLGGMISQCSVFAGNDSGPKHMAVSVDTPTVTLFGPEHPFEWHPYPQEQHPYFFVEGLACRRDADPGMPPWCGLDVCKEEQHQCMTRIGIDAVLDACERVSRTFVEPRP